MRTIHLVSFVAIVLGCGACKEHHSKDSSYDARFVGVWAGIENDPTLLISDGKDIYLPDGTGCGYTVEVGPKGTRIWGYTDTWKITGDQLTITAVETNSPYFNAGYSSHDTIEEITAVHLKLKDDDGTEYYRYRSNSQSKVPICLVVERHIRESPALWH